MRKIDMQYIRDMPTSWRVLPKNVKPHALGVSLGDLVAEVLERSARFAREEHEAKSAR